MTISPTIRQVIVIGTCILGAFSAGGAIAYPMVLLRQLRGDDSPIKLDLHAVSWIGAMTGMAGVFSLITPPCMQRMGRRTAYIAASLTVTLGWIVAFTATNVTVILISEFIHGFGTNSLYVISILTMSEMTSPTFRNVSVQSYGILQGLGMAISGVLSSFLGYKYICVIMSIPIVIAFCMSLMWAESPPWLACKGRFDECHEAFRKLRKFDTSSQMELEELIAAQKENLSRDKENNKRSFVFLYSKIKRRDFYLPVIHTFILLNMIYWSGSAVVLIHAFDLIQQTTNNDKAAFWGGIAINIMFFIGTFLSSIINKQFKTKTVLLTSAVFTSTSLFAVFLVTLLQSTDYISKESLLCPYFFITFITFDTLGIIPMVFTIASEIMPVKHRGLGGAVFIVINSFLFSTSMKLSPYLFSINIWGTFLLFTFNGIICGILIWRFVPETKNKTLQQIEDFYVFGKFIENRTQCSVSKPCIADC